MSGRVIVCEPRADCADPNVNRWYCMRGHDGAAPNVCPLKVCERRGANRVVAPRHEGSGEAGT